MLSLIILFLLLALPILTFSIPTLRRRYITSPILTWFKKTLPPINTTERIALEVGDVSWEKELFCGTPNWRKLASMPQSTLTSEESAFLDNQVETLCQMLNDWEIVNTYQDLSPTVWKYLKKEGFASKILLGGVDALPSELIK